MQPHSNLLTSMVFGIIFSLMFLQATAHLVRLATQRKLHWQNFISISTIPFSPNMFLRLRQQTQVRSAWRGCTTLLMIDFPEALPCYPLTQMPGSILSWIIRAASDSPTLLGKAKLSFKTPVRFSLTTVQVSAHVLNLQASSGIVSCRLTLRLDFY